MLLLAQITAVTVKKENKKSSFTSSTTPLLLQKLPVLNILSFTLVSMQHKYIICHRKQLKKPNTTLKGSLTILSLSDRIKEMGYGIRKDTAYLRLHDKPCCKNTSNVRTHLGGKHHVFVNFWSCC